MTEQGTLFETPKERTSREHNEQLAAYMAERKVPGGWQCQDCGGIAPTDFTLWLNHGQMGARCMRVYLRRNHALYGLRTGDPVLWATATADLRLIAAWRAAR